MHCSKERKFVVVPFSTNQSVFCDLQEFFHVRFQTSKLTSTCDLNIDVNHNVYSNNCSLLHFDRFLDENILSINLKVHFPGWCVGHYGILPVLNSSILMYSRQQNNSNTLDKSCQKTDI